MTMTRDLENLFDGFLFPRSYNMGFQRKISTNYPPYNIIQKDENTYLLEIALAGFSMNELEIVVKDNELIISGSKTSDTDVNYCHKGISAKSFKRAFALAPEHNVQEASFHDGILSICVAYEVPEEKKPKQIPINANTDRTLLVG